jgi:hypothetical protein
MPVSASEEGRPENEGWQGALRLPARFWWLGVSALSVIVGSLGPWADHWLGQSESGLDRYGWVALIGGGASLGAGFRFARTHERPRPSWPLVVCATAAVASAAIAVYEWTVIEGGGILGTDSAGWGLYLTWVASVSLFLASAVCVGRDTSAAAWSAAFSGRHRLFTSALRWTGFVLLGADVVMLTALGQGLIVTGPETETLGQGFVGALLVTGAILLALVGLLAYWFPRLAGTLLMFMGLPLFLAAAADERASECDPNCWVASDRQGELSGLGAAVANSDVLSLMLFLIPPIAGLVIFVAAFLRHRNRATAPPAQQPPAAPPVVPA